MKKLLIIFFLFITYVAQAQIKGVVLDSASNQPIAFVNLYDAKVQRGTVTDAQGKFSLNYTPEKLRVSCVGYNTKEIRVNQDQFIVYLSEKTVELSALEIKPGVNPALRIVDNVIRNKKSNMPGGDYSYYCETFTKFQVTGELDEKQNVDSLLQSDSNFVDAYQFFEKQHLFLMETVAERYYEPGSNVKEKIVGTKTAGFENPMFAALATQFQSFSFYEDYISIFDQKLLNPFSKSAQSKYVFVLEKSEVVMSDSVFTIYFQPRSKATFPGLKGYVVIDGKTWGFRKVNVQPENVGEYILNWEETNITQLYRNYRGKLWFPQVLKIDAITDAISVNGFPTSIVNVTKVDQLQIDLEQPLKWSNVAVKVEKESNNKDSLYWNEKRGKPLTEKEAQTYHTIDSLSQKMGIEKRMENMIALTRGVWRWKILDIDIFKLFDFNNHEGLRLGAGLSTNERLIPWMNIGGHFGYGFKDKTYKYGGFLDFALYKPRNVRLKVGYEKDVFPVGSRIMDSRVNILNPTEMYSAFFIEDMDDYQKVFLEADGYINDKMKIGVFGSFTRYFSNDSLYAFKDDLLGQSFKSLEVGLEYHWEINAKKMQLPSGLFSIKSGNPILGIKIAQGLQTSFSDFNYTRILLRWDHQISLKGNGTFSYNINGQKIFGEVPRTLLFYGNGTNKGFGVVAMNTFETMIPLEFLSDQSAAIHLAYETPALKTKIEKWFRPSLMIRTSAGWGSFSQSDFHQGIQYRTMEKGYFESGLVINNILRLSTIGLGVGAFYRYGPYAFDSFKDNFAVKLSLTLGGLF